MYSNIMGYNIFKGSKEELMEIIKNSEAVNVISGNPAILNLGLNNQALFNNFNEETSIIVPDGVGTVVSCKLAKKPVKEKIAGIEVMDAVVKYCSESGKGVYLLGGEDEIVSEAVLKLKDKYRDLNIAGYHNGFFDLDNCEELVEDIANKKPYAIFVAMGCPRQEEFIMKYWERIGSTVIMGVGGSFDIVAGKLNRAPKWMLKLGLEWLYRVIKEPFRIKRLGAIPRFIAKVFYNERIKKRRSV